MAPKWSGRGRLFSPEIITFVRFPADSRPLKASGHFARHLRLLGWCLQPKRLRAGTSVSPRIMAVHCWSRVASLEQPDEDARGGNINLLMSTFPTLGGLWPAGRLRARLTFLSIFLCGRNLFRQKGRPPPPPPGDKEMARTMAAQIGNRIFHSTSAILARRFLFGYRVVTWRRIQPTDGTPSRFPLSAARSDGAVAPGFCLHHTRCLHFLLLITTLGRQSGRIDQFHPKRPPERRAVLRWPLSGRGKNRTRSPPFGWQFINDVGPLFERTSPMETHTLSFIAACRWPIAWLGACRDGRMRAATRRR
jgi:hypothetical protein